MNKKIFFLVLYFISPVIPILVTFTSNPDKYSDPTFLISMILGAIAYTWLVAEFILSARPKFIEKYFGLDKFYRFHGLMAVISVILVLAHKLIEENIFGKFLTTEIGDAAWLVFVVIVVLALVFMADTTVSRLKPIFLLRKFMEKIKIAKYEFQVAIHNLTLIGLVLLFVHVLLTSSAIMSLLVRSVYILYFAVGVGFYLYHKVIKGILLNDKSFVVKELIKESHNMWTIKLAPVKGSIFSYKPGQFGFFRFFGKNIKREEHPFSISSEPTNREYLSVTIKELGDYTSNIKNIQIGYRAQVDAPYGKFCYLDNPSDGGIVLIAGGVGITPILSMLRYMRSQDKNRSVILIWGINNFNDLICFDEFKEMQKEMKNFLFVPVAFKDDTWEGEKGIIDSAKIQSILNKHGLDVTDKEYYVCGPANMLKLVLAALKSLGVKKSKIHFERFSV